MLRARLFVVCVIFASLALAAAAAAGAVSDQGKDPKSARAEFTVASTSANASTAADENAATATESAVTGVVTTRAMRLGPFPPSLTLLVVGTMLIGLAAAVRRTT